MSTRLLWTLATLGLVVVGSTVLELDPAHASRSNSSRGRKRGPQALVDADFHAVRNDTQVQLGRLLFFDKVLSGNRNISCATCHHPLTGTGDGLSLGVGEGGHGLGAARNTGEGSDEVHERVPRNAPALFNLGAREYRVMFHDGRVVEDPGHPSGFQSPAGGDLPTGLDNTLAAQAMFPVTSPTEMAGQSGENPVADAAVAGRLAGPDGVWEQLAARLRDIPEYVALFQDAYDDVATAEDVTMVHVANAIAAYETVAFRADDSPYDEYLRGRSSALTKSQRKGLRLFNGRAGCVTCHAGPLQTDHGFHAIAMPQFGPGKGGGVDGADDLGREHVTEDSRDRYRFRTPSLRNVALTGPWGHTGAYDTLEAVVRHHLDPVRSLREYDLAEAVLSPNAELETLDRRILDDSTRVEAIAARNELAPKRLSDRDVECLVDFLHALTDSRVHELRREVPTTVPSGLPVAD